MIDMGKKLEKATELEENLRRTIDNYETKIADLAAEKLGVEESEKKLPISKLKTKIRRQTSPKPFPLRLLR